MALAKFHSFCTSEYAIQFFVVAEENKHFPRGIDSSKF